jgi:hypothetical protein
MAPSCGPAPQGGAAGPACGAGPNTVPKPSERLASRNTTRPDRSRAELKSSRPAPGNFQLFCPKNRFFGLRQKLEIRKWDLCVIPSKFCVGNTPQAIPVRKRTSQREAARPPFTSAIGTAHDVAGRFGLDHGLARATNQPTRPGSESGSCSKQKEADERRRSSSQETSSRDVTLDHLPASLATAGQHSRSLFFFVNDFFR